MGKLYVIGLGPGGAEGMTECAKTALMQSELICGYTVYVELVKRQFPQKQVLATPMTKEIERCHAALAAAQQGQTVAMVCSGDSGVYGMASPLMELLPQYAEVELEVIPGVTAALAGAAQLGAPLANDFAVISLSDLLTPWETIAQRLRAAAAGDFSIALYNPASRRRTDHLRHACKILLETMPEQTICGWVRNIGREGLSLRTLTLKQLAEEQVDMFTTILIGMRATSMIGNWMVTPRGYRQREKIRKKRAVLVASFGTTYSESCDAAIAGVEQAIMHAFSGWELRRAYTSNMIRRILKKRDGILVDSVCEALERLAREDFCEVVLQPTHLMHGEEYDKLMAQASPYIGRFERLRIGRPLLSAAEDYQKAAQAILEQFPQMQDAAWVLMGHGTEHFADAAYAALNWRLEQAGCRSIYIAMVEGSPTLEDALEWVCKHGFKKIKLAPLMLVAGDHAKNDMAGDWREAFERIGCEVACSLHGLGEYPVFQKLYTAHAQQAE